ncbi:uncharacterized protein LOC130613142 [Hydractinia symbiolongicarpus]|uniref:uncharacterized protein LOC130613142 n=1 Tax=Hydractinia symbiolongicarpus TaxID=13093 RepID=UPI0025509FD0|nr:uncharacterized protein LOC130613142 [Hydractinia symbiolongicarpus]
MIANGLRTSGLSLLGPGLMFLGCLLLLLVVLLWVYCFAKGTIENYEKEMTEYLQLESSDDEELNEYVPRNMAKKFREEQRAYEEKDNPTVFAEYLSEAERCGRKIHDNKAYKDGESFNPTLLPVETVNEKYTHVSCLHDSGFRTRIEFKFRHDFSTKELSFIIVSVKDFLDRQHGGPEKIKFVIKFYQNKKQKKCQRKLTTKYFGVNELLPPYFQISNIDDSLLSTMIIKVKVLGKRKNFPNDIEHALGAIYFNVGELFHESNEVSVTRSLFPLENEFK